MNLFLTNKEKLISRSNSILDVFTSTLGKLQDVNQEVNLEQKKLDEEMQKILDDKVELEKITQRNTKIMDKITSFLEE
jgi:hypothetical protein